MDIRLKDLIQTIERLPTPQYDGQILRADILTELPPAVDRHSASVSDAAVTAITLRAETYARGYHSRWLEWHLIELND